MKSLQNAVFLVLIVIIIFSCEKKTMPIDPVPETKPCLYEKFKKESVPHSLNDSFYFTG